MFLQTLLLRFTVIGVQFKVDITFSVIEVRFNHVKIKNLDLKCKNYS